ncbi:MAG: AI-2E family transporter [Gemmataceae bacterium]
MSVDARHNPYRPLIILGVIITLAVVLGLASKVFIPIALGILLTFILAPAVALLQARGLRRRHAVVLVVVITMVLLGLLAAGLAIQLRELATDLPHHKLQITTKVRDLTGRGPGLFENLTRLLDEINAEVQKDRVRTPEMVVPVRVQPERTSSVTLLSLIAGPLAGTLGAISLTIGLTVSMLILREDLRNRLFLLLGDGHLTTTTRAMDEVSQRISRYLITQVVLNASFGTLFGLGLWAMGVNYALVWGVLAAFLRFVPYVGTWMAVVFPVLVSLATFEGWLRPLGVIGYVVFLGAMANYVVEPMLTLRATGVTPIALVVAMAFWTYLWGPIGLILSTPITVCLSVLGKHVPSLHFLDVLLGTAAPLDVDMKYYQRVIAHDEIEASDLIEEFLAEHTPEGLFDQVILPALARARQDRERGNLREDEMMALVRMTRELLQASLGDITEGETSVVMTCCPAYDALDTLAVELLVRSLSGRARMHVVASDATASDLLASIEEREPALVCLVGLPPAGSSRLRYLCKRLRARFPQLSVVVGLWGIGADDNLAEQLRAAGASQVSTNPAATRAQIIPLLQVAQHLETV